MADSDARAVPSVPIWTIRLLLSTVTALLLLASCYQPGPQAEIDVGVIPRAGSWPSELHLLQVGEAAWRIGPDGGAGAVTFPTTEPQTVRVVRASDCRVLVSFEGLVGHRYNLIVGLDDQITVDDVTEGAWENGPAIPLEADNPCPL